MLVATLYEGCLWLYALYALPKMAWQRICRGKYRDSFAKRLGFGFPLIEKGNRPLVWIHAVSVGETKAVAQLAKRIKEKRPEVLLLVSTITETAHAEAQKSLSFADYHVYLPFDLRPIIAPIVRRVKPDLVILTETDYWLNFLNAAKQQGARLFVVNAKLSERSTKRLQSFPSYTKALFNLFDALAVQSKHYLKRFETLGVDSQKLYLTGNLKFDAQFPRRSSEEIAAWREKLRLQPADFVLVIGSSHDPEERLLLSALKPLIQTHADFKIVLVPRHPDRVSAIETLLKELGFSFARLSQITSESPSLQIVIVDRMGVLLQCYEAGDLALVAGSYTDKVGGHNIFEPVAYEKPLLFGPHMHSQPEMVELVNEFRAGLQITSEELLQTIKELLNSPEQRNELTKQGLLMLESVQGSLERTWKVIEPTLLAKSTN